MATHSATATLQRRTLGVFTTNVVVLGIGYVASIMLARFLGADGRGLVAVILTGASVLAGILGIGTQEAATYYASRRARRRGVVLGNGLAHAGVLLVFSLAVAFVGMGELQQRVAPAYDARIWLLAALLVPTFYLDVLVSNLLSAQSAFALRNRLSIGGRITTAVATLAIVGWLGWGVAGALIATAPTLLVPAFGGLRLLARNGIAFSRHVHAASLRYGARIQVGAMLKVLNARFDVLVLAAFVPSRPSAPMRSRRSWPSWCCCSRTPWGTCCGHRSPRARRATTRSRARRCGSTARSSLSASSACSSSGRP